MIRLLKKIKIFRWKQEFIGDIDDDESWNYVFLPRNPPRITNTDSDLAHFIKVSGDVCYDASTSTKNNKDGIHSLNSGVF